MELRKLIFAVIYRDGGSYGAAFETDDGRTYNIRLQRSRMPDAAGLHHRWLFEYFGERFGDERPENCRPVVTGSTEERALLARLNAFMASVYSASLPDADLTCVTELIRHIERREPCFPYDSAP